MKRKKKRSKYRENIKENTNISSDSYTSFYGYYFKTFSSYDNR